MARQMGADVVIDCRKLDPIKEVKQLTNGVGVDVAIEALGTQQTFEGGLRPGGTLSSLGVYSGKLQIPFDAFNAGLGDHKIVTTLCPGGKMRMRWRMNVVRRRSIRSDIAAHALIPAAEINKGYRIFGDRLDGVLKVAIRPRRCNGRVHAKTLG